MRAKGDLYERLKRPLKAFIIAGLKSSLRLNSSDGLKTLYSGLFRKSKCGLYRRANGGLYGRPEGDLKRLLLTVNCGLYRQSKSSDYRLSKGGLKRFL